MRLVVTYDSAALRTAITGLDEAAAGKLRTRLAGVVNAVGAAAHESLIAPLKTQTGLTGSTIPRAVHDLPAGEGGLAYTLVTRGGDISLRYFGAHEVAGGVVARPRGVVKTFSGSFIRSGRAPNRFAVPKLNNQVYERVTPGTAWSTKKDPVPIKKAKSGVFIPKEMVRGAALSAFETVVAGRLEPEIAGLMTMILGGKKIK